ncbi:MAG: ATP-grasp domain-containing protein [Chloroflexi bacterium]|nr:ATP-grasp domain-containing protein [Chloroflexota bacterium]
MLYAHGEFYARFAQWAKRTDPPLGGQSVLRQSIAVPDDIGSQAERLVREIELEGYSEIEFRRDSAGVPYLMEINPRLSASIEIAVRSGVNFPHLLYQWANGERIDKVMSYRLGNWMRYLTGDIMTTIAALQQRDDLELRRRARLYWISASLFSFLWAMTILMFMTLCLLLGRQLTLREVGLEGQY